MNNTDNENSALPVIEAQLGDTWEDVARHSTFHVKPLPSPAGTIIDTPHSFVYRDPKHRMELENVGYLTVAANYETHRLISLGIGPYRESAEADQTWQRLQEIERKMELAHWLPDDERNKRNPSFKSKEEMRHRYQGMPGGATGAEKIWYDDEGNEAWVALVKTITGEDPNAESRFNIVVQIQVATNPKKPKATQPDGASAPIKMGPGGSL